MPPFEAAVWPSPSDVSGLSFLAVGMISEPTMHLHVFNLLRLTLFTILFS